MALQDHYLDQIYAAVLGKVIGVYMGRPFEGWSKKHIEAKFGEIDRYVHEEQDTHSKTGVPLIVADDDITGTFTFVRALEDSGCMKTRRPNSSVTLGLTISLKIKRFSGGVAWDTPLSIRLT